MQPLNLDSASRTPAPEPSVYTGSDASRPSTSESFGSHLHRADDDRPLANSRSNDSPPVAKETEQEPAPVEQRAPVDEPAAAPEDPPTQSSSEAEPTAADGSQTENDAAATDKTAMDKAANDKAANDKAVNVAATFAQAEAFVVPAVSQELVPPEVEVVRPSVRGDKRDPKLRAVTRDGKIPPRQAGVTTPIALDAKPAPRGSDPQAVHEKPTTKSTNAKLKAAAKRSEEQSPNNELTLPVETAVRPTAPVDPPKTDLPVQTADPVPQENDSLPVQSLGDEETTSLPAAVLPTDGLRTTVEQLPTRKHAEPVELAVEQRKIDAVAAPLPQVPSVETEPVTSPGKRAPRAARGEAAVDATKSADLPVADRLQETLTAIEQLPAPIANPERIADEVTSETTLAPVNSAPTMAPTTGPPQMRFAQHLAAKPGERVAKTPPLSDLERVRLVDRVARAFQAAEGRGGTVTLRLHPPELGILRVEMRVVEGALSARLEAETPAARAALLDNVQVLQDRLAEQGVRIERFDVDLLDRRSSGDAPAFEHDRPREQNNRHQPTPDASHHELHETESPRPNGRPIATGQLNVVI